MPYKKVKFTTTPRGPFKKVRTYFKSIFYPLEEEAKPIEAKAIKPKTEPTPKKKVGRPKKVLSPKKTKPGKKI